MRKLSLTQIVALEWVETLGRADTGQFNGHTWRSLVRLGLVEFDDLNMLVLTERGRKALSGGE